MPEKHTVEGSGNRAKVSIYFHGALFLMICCKFTYDNGQTYDDIMLISPVNISVRHPWMFAPPYICNVLS